MKKILSIVTLILFFSVQSVIAQTLTEDQDRPEVIAKAQVDMLTSKLELTGEQSRTLYRAFVLKEVNYKKHITGKDLKDASVALEKRKIDSNLNKSIKNTLTEDQYKTWLVSRKNN